MDLYSEGLVIGRIFACDLGAYFREGLFLGGLLSEFYGMLHTSNSSDCVDCHPMQFDGILNHNLSFELFLCMGNEQTK